MTGDCSADWTPPFHVQMDFSNFMIINSHFSCVFCSSFFLFFFDKRRLIKLAASTCSIYNIELNRPKFLKRVYFIRIDDVELIALRHRYY